MYAKKLEWRDGTCWHDKDFQTNAIKSLLCQYVELKIQHNAQPFFESEAMILRFRVYGMLSEPFKLKLMDHEVMKLFALFLAFDCKIRCNGWFDCHHLVLHGKLHVYMEIWCVCMQCIEYVQANWYLEAL